MWSQIFDLNKVSQYWRMNKVETPCLTRLMAGSSLVRNTLTNGMCVCVWGVQGGGQPQMSENVLWKCQNCILTNEAQGANKWLLTIKLKSVGRGSRSSRPQVQPERLAGRKPRGSHRGRVGQCRAAGSVSLVEVLLSRICNSHFIHLKEWSERSKR